MTSRINGWAKMGTEARENYERLYEHDYTKFAKDVLRFTDNYNDFLRRKTVKECDKEALEMLKMMVEDMEKALEEKTEK